jgi:hypothetical protein
MKTTEFLNKTLKESFDPAEYRDEVGMVKNNLHTLVRAATDLGKCLKDNEDLPEWVQEKIANAKGMMVAASEYLQSQHTMGHQPEVPSFNMESAYKQYQELLGEDATGGASSSSSVAAVVTELGGTTKDLIKRQKAYTNQQTAGGKVKVKNK